MTDRHDVAHLTVRILDDQGRALPDADNEITFEIEGEGLLLATDNGDPANHADYKSNRRKAFNGMCLAIVKSNGKAGGFRSLLFRPGFQPLA